MNSIENLCENSSQGCFFKSRPVDQYHIHQTRMICGSKSHPWETKSPLEIIQGQNLCVVCHRQLQRRTENKQTFKEKKEKQLKICQPPLPSIKELTLVAISHDAGHEYSKL